jgi:hypothetical protein
MCGYAVNAVVLALLTATAANAGAAPRPGVGPRPQQLGKQLDAAWEDLQSTDELIASRALLWLASHRDAAVGYLKKKLRPLNLRKGRAYFLIAQLGVPNEMAARPAFEELRYFDPRLALDDDELRKVMADNPPADRRLGEILCDLPMNTMSGGPWHWNSPDNKVYRFSWGEGHSQRDVPIAVSLVGKGGRKATWARASRAVAVLEFIGTPQARAVLADLATGHPDAAPTKAARAAWERLRR